jgi:hypothetical protein
MKNNFPIYNRNYLKDDLIYFLTDKPKNISLEIVFHNDDSCDLIYSICDDAVIHLFIYNFLFKNNLFILNKDYKVNKNFNDIDEFLKQFLY